MAYQQHNFGLESAADNTRKEVEEKIRRTTRVVLENISKILAETPSTSSTSSYQNVPFAAADFASALPHPEFVRLPSQTITSSAIPIPPLDFSTPNEQPANVETVQNFVVSPNDIPEVGQDAVNGDEIIWLDSSPSLEGPFPNECLSSSVEQSSASSTRADHSFVSVSPLPARVSAASNAVAHTADTPNRKQSEKGDVWKDETVVALLHHYAEWSIKYPKRHIGMKLLVAAVEKRAQEIDRHFIMDNKMRNSLKGRLVRIRTVLYKEKGSDGQQMNAQTMAVLQNTTNQREQLQRPSMSEQSTEARNSPTDESDEDEIEILGCYQSNGNIGVDDHKANATFSDDEANGDNRGNVSDNESADEINRCEWNNDFLRMTENAFAQLRGEEMGGETMSTDGTDAAPNAVKESPIQLAKRSKPFNRTVAGNCGLVKKFVRIPSKRGNIFGLVEKGAIASCDQRLLGSLKNSQPAIFSRNDEFVLQSPDEKTMNGNKKLEASLEQINEFDEFYARWLSNVEQEEERRKKIEDEEESENEDSDGSEEDEESGDGRMCRGPVIKCPRLPRVRVLVSPVRTRRELSQET